MILIPYLIGMCAGIYIGTIFANKKNELEEQKELEEAEYKATHIQAYIKKCDDIYYVYNAEDDHFLAQGKTPDEVESHLSKRFPNVKVYASKENLIETGYEE